MSGNERSPRELLRSAGIPDPVVQLLRLAGPRRAAPKNFEDEVRSAVRSHWLETLETRSHSRRRWYGILAAAAVLAAAIGLSLWRPVVERGLPGPAVIVATVATTSGPVWVSEGSQRRLLAAGEQVAAGSAIETAAEGLVAFHRHQDQGSPTSVRLDRSTRLRWDSPGSLALERGGIYVDAPGGGKGLEIRTPFGIAREIGTQFEVRVDGDALRLRVREGRVELERDDGAWEARAGEELLWRSGSGLWRGRVAFYGEPWAWTLTAAPPFDLEGRTLGSILAWVSRETGWAIRFADETARRTHASDILYGTMKEVRADQVPQRVLPAFGLLSRLEDGILTLEEK